MDFVAFCRAAIGLVFNECSGVAGAARAAGAAQGALVWTISSCVSGRTMVSPGRHQPGRCKRTPCGSSWWWKMCSCTARSQCCCELGRPADRCRLTDGQHRPRDRAMAVARPARHRARRSPDQLTRKIAQWKNTYLRVKGLLCDHKSNDQS